MNRFDLLNKVQNILKDNLVICNIGLPSQELYKISDQPNFFLYVRQYGLIIFYWLRLGTIPK